MEYKTPEKKLIASRKYQSKVRQLNAYYHSLDPLELVNIVKEKYGV